MIVRKLFQVDLNEFQTISLTAFKYVDGSMMLKVNNNQNILRLHCIKQNIDFCFIFASKCITTYTYTNNHLTRQKKSK